MNKIEQIIKNSGLTPSHETINLANNIVREAVNVILSQERHRRDFFAAKVLEHFNMEPIKPTSLKDPISIMNLDVNPNLSEEELEELEREMEEWNRSFKF